MKPAFKAVRQSAIKTVRALRLFPLYFRRSHRAILIEPYLTGPIGHNLNFDIGFVRALERRGWETRILAHRYAKKSVASELGALHRFFSSAEHSNLSPYQWFFWKKNCEFYSDLQSLSFCNFSPYNVILLHTVSIFEIFGLTRWYGELAANARPRLIIYIQLGPDFGLTRADEIALARSFFRIAGNELAKFPGALICASSTGLLELFHKEDVLPDLVCLPIFWQETPKARAQDGRVVFGYFGGAKRIKGFHLIADAVREVLEIFPNVDFVINCPYDPEFERDFSAMREMGPRIKLAFAVRETADYYAQFAEVDVVLNAYDPAHYRDATSMICLETIGMGKGIITVEGTWSDRAAREVGAAVVTMREFSSRALVEAIGTYMLNQISFRRKAEVAQERVRDVHNVDSFLNDVGVR